MGGGAGLGRRVASVFHRFASGLGVAVGALVDNKFRAVMTSLGIVIGVMTVTGILSIINGLDRGVTNQMELMGVRTLYVSVRPWMMRGGWHRFRNRPPITDWQYRRLVDLVGFAEAISPLEHHRSKIKRGLEVITDVGIRGVNSEFARITGYTVERGRFFAPVDVLHERPLVVLGSEVADKLFPGTDPLGGEVDINGLYYRVIGVLKSQGSFLGRSQDVTAIVPVGRFRRAFGRRHSMEIAVKVAPGLDMDEAAEELTGIMRRVRGLRPQERDDFSVNQQKTLGNVYRDITGTLYLVIVIVAFISLAVGGIGIMNIMLVSVTERTREIGVRMALGARRRTVLFQFLIESLVLSGVGGLAGLGCGLLVAGVVDSVSPLPAAVSVFAVVAGLGFSALVGVFFGMYPAWRASRLDPIVALRYE